jgi:hypothetical protein
VTRSRRTCAGKLLPTRGSAGVADNIERAWVNGLLHARALWQERVAGDRRSVCGMQVISWWLWHVPIHAAAHEEGAQHSMMQQVLANSLPGHRCMP